jgi:hypothetical protein
MLRIGVVIKKIRYIYYFYRFLLAFHGFDNISVSFYPINMILGTFLKGIYSTTKDRSQPVQTSPCGLVFLRSFAVLVFCGPPIFRSFAVFVRSSPGLWLVPGLDLQTLSDPDTTWLPSGEKTTEFT